MEAILNRFSIYQKSTIMILKQNLNGIWFFCSIYPASSCSLLEKENDTRETTHQLTSIVIGLPFEVVTTTLPTSGEISRAVQTFTPLDDLGIWIPANAFQVEKTFRISCSEIASQNPGKYFNTISPVISISYDGDYSSFPSQITIPNKITEFHAIAFYPDELSGKIERLPDLELSAHSITKNIRHFMSGSGRSVETANMKIA
jgi:hypothetical protein